VCIHWEHADLAAQAGLLGFSEGPREVIGEGGEREPNQILMQELAYVPSLIPKPKHYKKVMNTPTNNVEMISSKLRMQ
jgi:hypothetical protein